MSFNNKNCTDMVSTTTPPTVTPSCDWVMTEYCASLCTDDPDDNAHCKCVYNFLGGECITCPPGTEFGFNDECVEIFPATCTDTSLSCKKGVSDILKCIQNFEIINKRFFFSIL